jgi:hypothetical protein
MDSVSPQVPPPPATAMDSIYTFPTYLLRQKMLHLLGGRVDVYAPDGRAVMCCLQKAFKLKEDITIYTDDTKTQPLLQIKARQILDFSAAYDITDARTGERIGVLRRKGWSSIVRDAWEVLSAREEFIAKLEEDHIILALLRRFINLIPQSYHFAAANGAILARAHQNFNPFIHKMILDMPQGEHAAFLDPRLVLAATLLLVLIEGRQE